MWTHQLRDVNFLGLEVFFFLRKGTEKVSHFGAKYSFLLRGLFKKKTVSSAINNSFKQMNTGLILVKSLFSTVIFPMQKVSQPLLIQ